MQYKKILFSIISSVFLFAAPSLATAQQPTVVTVEKAPNGSAVKSPADLLPDNLAGVAATSEIKEYKPENLAEIAGDQTTIFQNYKVISAASRSYGTTRLDVFQTESPFASFGLFNYLAAQSGSKPLAKGIGSGSLRTEGGLVFWKSRFFIKVNGTPSLAPAVAEKIPPDENDGPPPLYKSLPADSRVAGSEHYFLGGQTLGSYVAHADDMFLFEGDAEAAFAEYRVGAKPNARTEGAKSAPPMKLVIAEYHTPQFATLAMNHAQEVFDSLPPEEQNHIVLKRVGNFVVEATNVENREFAEKLVASIEYPYVVKMLKDPSLPFVDPDHDRKAAEMLLSTFGLIGVTGVVVLVCGSIIGTAVFFKRRKQQREVFSDAGGMLRLQLDPIEDAILSLPPGQRE